MNMFLRRLPSGWALASALALSACGGGGGASTSAGPALAGTAAVGAALANASVVAKCTAGPDLTGTTDSAGRYNLALTSSHTAPCIVQVAGGSPSITLYGYATAAGTVNVTPLTDLVLTKALGAAPANAFASFDSTTAATIGAGLTAAKTYVNNQVKAMTGSSPSADPLNGAFAVGDANDRLLDTFGAATTAAGKSFQDLQTAVAAGTSDLTSVVPEYFGPNPCSTTTVAATTPTPFTLANAPQKLSAWNLYSNDCKKITYNAKLQPYNLNSTLFTDYAFKLRAMYVPDGKTVGYTTDGALDFPIGTVLVKTFYYPKTHGGTDSTALAAALVPAPTESGNTIELRNHRLMETRLLVRKDNGAWEGIPYVWDDNQQDATLQKYGATRKMELVSADGSSQPFTYGVPDKDTCALCHGYVDKGVSPLPIGPKTKHLNRDYTYGDGVTRNQLVYLKELGILTGFDGNTAAAPKLADWRNTNATLGDRAKSYLDINCAHCHWGNAGAGTGGDAVQSGLLLNSENIGNPATQYTWGVCKLPLAYVGGPSTAYKYDVQPGSPEYSILLYRMRHIGSGQTMPKVGRQTNHTEATQMISDWISSLTGSCP